MQAKASRPSRGSAQAVSGKGGLALKRAGAGRCDRLRAVIQDSVRRANVNDSQMAGKRCDTTWRHASNDARCAVRDGKREGFAAADGVSRDFA
jgi:hypothetical protein